MGVWTSRLASYPIDWLLEADNPSVRYFALTELLELPESDAQASEAKRNIMHRGVVPAILEKQVDGRWNEPGKFYTSKYHGSVWQLIVLAEHGADGSDPRISTACEYVLESSQDRQGHGFSHQPGARGSGGRHTDVIPCLTGNMVWSLIRLGFLEDERVQRAIDWIARYQRFDDGDTAPPSQWPYDRYEICWGRHTCHMAAIKSLKAVSALPPEQRDERIESVIGCGCEYFLAHHIYKRSHDLSKVSKPGWLRFQFPLMYQTDVLEVTRILLDLGYRDDRMQEAIDCIAGKQDPEGTWRLESTFNGKFQVDIERKGRPSKWITLRALSVLKRFYS